MLSGIGLKPELPFAPDVVHVLLDARDGSSASRHFHHDFRNPPNRSRDEFLLGRGQRFAAPTIGNDIKNRRLGISKINDSFFHNRSANWRGSR